VKPLPSRSFVDHGVHGAKGLIVHGFVGVAMPLLPRRLRRELDESLCALHNGGATVRSCAHRRVEISACGHLLTADMRQELGEVAEALDRLAMLIKWGLRVSNAQWCTCIASHITA
jgi:hypothetical protein